VIFFYFWHNKIHISPTNVVSSLSPSQCHLSSSQYCHAATSCHAYFPLSQDEITTSTSYFGNTSSSRQPSRAETKALNQHHCHMLPSPDRSTLNLHCYKKIISAFTTLPTTQPCLYCTSSRARASHHQSSTHRRRFFHHCLKSIIHPHNDIYGDELSNHLLLFKQFIGT
jgi:hypothetical protein